MPSLLESIIHSAIACIGELHIKLQERDARSWNLHLTVQRLLEKLTRTEEELLQAREKLEDCERNLYFERYLHNQTKMELERLEHEWSTRVPRVQHSREQNPPSSAIFVQREPCPNAVAEGRIPDHVLFPDADSPSAEGFEGIGEHLKAPAMVRTSFIYGTPVGFFPPMCREWGEGGLGDIGC